MDFLHHYHAGEDERLYPLVRAKDPRTAELLDAMDREHESIAGPIVALRKAGEAAAHDATPVDERAERLHEAIGTLRAALDPHLEHEERVTMPVVERVLTREEWDAFEASNTDRPKSELAEIGHWMIDGLDDEHVRLITGVVPPIPRFVRLKFLGKTTRKRARVMWANTPAATIRSVPLRVGTDDRESSATRA